MNNLMKIESPELELLELSKAQAIKSAFDPMIKGIEAFEREYYEVVAESSKGIDERVCAMARQLRLKTVKLRAETGRIKDKQKEYIKLEDKAIMGVHNILVYAVKEKEDKLLEIEKHFEKLEADRIQKICNERRAQLSPYCDPDVYALSDMADDVFQHFLAGKKSEYEARKKAEELARLEREAKAKEEAEEREKLRLENERLRQEAIERDKLEQARRAKEKAEREAQEAIARQERLILEAELKVKAEIERKEREKIEAERAEANRLRLLAEAELAQKKAIEEETRLREADAFHRKTKLNEVRNDLIDVCEITYEQATTIVDAIRKQKIKNITINY